MQITKTGLAAVTLGGGSAVDIFKPDVTWLLNGCPGPRPDSVDELVTMLAIIIALFIWHKLTQKDPALVADLETADGEQPQDVAAQPKQE